LQQSNKFRAFGCRKLLIMLALSVKKLIVVEFEPGRRGQLVADKPCPATLEGKDSAKEGY
jgi:hypothetical protein